ncbi:ABC transporter permease [Nocardioides marmotae]|uniref:ABC transporter permease subunit n=1 Tax=Nocardioides marmotae TaxID=2663857 RepID=A0A6I3JHC3_9ACTN|nr:ABC transporter permease [Nocardioides marmotae]MCR6033695.1 ABC transporter permease subunit [Gordonia jinghuaiqii]MBC9735135.1 ABC transporter permease [Nocardioides marmotae]MTB86235.1 ABC transporter permease subunit [Nocardioides marmotae]MTB97353.1 ABC transporter permease subunit [Nocardioides marmotae]QKE01695.1 ABC transporter permease [Nocardioides marmotae]
MDTISPAVGVDVGTQRQAVTARRRRRRPPLHLLRRWVSPVALVALWQLASSTGVLHERKLASPAQVAATAADLVQAGTLGTQTLISLQRVGLGFAIGASIGLALAIVAGLSRIGEDAIDPPMQMLRTLPHFGLVTLFIIWFGIGETPKVALIALGATFPLYLNTLGGIRGIERKTLEAAKALHLTWAQRIRHVVIPGALPQTLVGLRQSLGIAWLSLIVAETIASQSGLGYMINHAKDFLQTDVIVVGLAVYSLLGLATDAIVRHLERKALAWRS